MNKKALNTAVLAGIAGVAGIANIANAVNLNPDGTGEVLLYPFYTVNGGNDTLLSVVNTTDQVKAVKVRFTESKNTQEVLDFNLYLSPFDVWTAAVTSTDADGPGVLITADESCTVPDIVDRPGGSIDFRNYQYVGDGGGDGLDRTREGHIEIIEMGVVNSVEGNATEGLGDNSIHDVMGIPEDCDALDAAWLPGGAWDADDQTDMNEPTGGLFGGAAIVNVFGGYQGGYTADAIDGFYDPTGATDVSLNSNPGSLNPSLLDATTGTSLDPVVANVFDSGDVFQASFTRGIDAVSAVLMRDAIMNEFSYGGVLDGATEWVITFPTKRFYVGGPLIDPPFTSIFGPESEEGAGDATASEPIRLNFYDREEGVPGTPPGDNDFSPLPPGVEVVGPQLPFESNVLSFGPAAEVGPTSTILGSPNARNIDPTAISATTTVGWASVEFADPRQILSSNDAVPLVFAGLPVTGFAMQIARNNTLTDAAGNAVLSNYASIFNHRSSRTIS